METFLHHIYASKQPLTTADEAFRDGVTNWPNITRCVLLHQIYKHNSKYMQMMFNESIYKKRSRSLTAETNDFPIQLIKNVMNVTLNYTLQINYRDCDSL